MALPPASLTPCGTLPADYQWTDDEDLEPTSVLRKEYEQLWNDSARIWDHVYKDDHREDAAFVAKFVARCLQINYRIGPNSRKDHDADWIRATLHLTWRANYGAHIATAVATHLYGYPRPGTFELTLACELEMRRDEPIRDILASEAPPRFTELANSPHDDDHEPAP